MRETVFIRPDRNTPDRFDWVKVDADGEPGMPARGAADEATLDCEGRRVVLLVPTESLLLTTVNVPARNRQRLMQALPFVLEDRLVQDVEQLHFAVGDRASDGSVAVAVTERRDLDGWLTRLRNAGIELDMAIPDVLALPFEPGTWTLLIETGVALVRMSAQTGFAADAGNLPVLIEQAVDESATSRPGRVVIYGDASALELDFLALGVESTTEPVSGSTLSTLARHFQEREAIDLLQGDYNRSERFGRLYRPWLPVAATLGAVLLINVVMTGVDYVRLGRENARLHQSIENLYRGAFPDAKRVVDPRVQMERGLQALRHGSDAGGFLDLMRAAAPLLGQTEGLTVQRVAYHENRLDLAVTAPDFQNLDGLKQRLSEQTGLEVEIQSASASNGRVEARLQLRARS